MPEKSVKKYVLDIISYELRKNNPKSISTKTLYNMFKANRMGFDEKNLCFYSCLCDKIKKVHKGIKVK